MQKLVKDLQKGIADFIEQRQALWLLVEAGAFEAVLLAQLLSEVERANDTDVFLSLSGNFETAEQYASEAAARLIAEYRSAAAALVGKGHPPLPPLPKYLFSASRSAAEKLRNVLQAAQALLPTGGGHRLVCLLWPLQISDGRAYVELLRQLLPSGSLPRWSCNLRLIVRELAEPRHDFSATWPPGRVKRLRCELSLPALTQHLQETACDMQQPEAERMQALLMLATLDHAHGRSEQAEGRYEQLLAYYEKLGNKTLQAMVMIKLGEVYHRREQMDRARHFYEGALLPAAQAPCPVLLGTLAKNLGDLASHEGRFTDADHYYEQWRRMENHLRAQERMANKARQRLWTLP
jgi:tetratricopeptide (TPR) repeat protein